MKKILYTACGKSVFGSGSGFQIYTLSKSFTADERKAIVSHVNTYTFVEGTNDQPIRNVYTYDDKLGYLYAQTKPAGVDYSSGRGGNFIGQAIIQTGNNPLLPIAVFGSKQLFGGALTKEEAVGPAPVDYLPDYAALPPISVNFGIVDSIFAQKNARERLCALVDAVISSLSGGKQILLCDTPENIINWLYAVTACLPLSFARMVTFDTYAYNPHDSNERIVCALPSGTAYAPSQYRASDKFVVFDFAHNLFTYNPSAGFYYQYLQSITSSDALKQLHALCEQELGAASGNVNVAQFLNGVSYLDYFLHCDARKALPSNGADVASRQNQIATLSRFLQQYHSAPLMDGVCNRVQELVTLSGQWSTALELHPLLFAPNVPVTDKATKAYRQFLISTLQQGGLKPNGMRPFFDFLNALSAEGANSDVVNYGLSVLISQKQEILSANFVDFRDFLKRLIAANDTTFQQGIGLVTDYLANHAQPQVLAEVANLLLEADRLRSRGPILASEYTKLFDSVCNRQTLSRDLLIELKREAQILDNAISGTRFVTQIMDKTIVYALSPAVPATQKDRVELLCQLFGGVNDAKLAQSVIESDVADVAKQTVMPIYINYCYELGKRQGMSVAYKQLGKAGNVNLIWELFNYAIKKGGGVTVCVEMVRADVGVIVASDLFKQTSTQLLLGDWYGNSTNSGRTFGKAVKSGFQEFFAAVNACMDTEKQRIVCYFANLLFEAAFTRHRMLLEDGSVCAFVDKYQQYLATDQELYAKFWLLRLLIRENKPKKIQSALESKDCYFKIQAWQDDRVPLLFERLIQLRALSLTEQSTAILADKFALDMSRNLDYYVRLGERMSYAIAYMQISRFGESKVRALFNYALENGNKVYACEELVRVGVNNLAKNHKTQPIFDRLIEDEQEMQPIFARALLGEWINYKNSQSSMRSFPKYTKSSFKDLFNACKGYFDKENVNVVQYFAELIFEQALTRPLMLMQDKNIWKFVDKFKKCLAKDEELIAKFTIVRVFITEKKPQKIQKRLEKECKFRIRRWHDVNAKQFIYEIAKMRGLSFTEDSINFMRNRLDLDLSEFVIEEKKENTEKK